MRKSLVAEFLGTAVLLMTVVGSGIMAEQLSGGNVGLALLANSLATGAMLVVLIFILGPISGAHFNPIVSVAMMVNGRQKPLTVLPYILVQVAGAVVGVLLAHGMFDLSLLQVSPKMRWSMGLWLAEAIAVVGLLLVIFGSIRHASQQTPLLVGLYITAAYWFTASTSFANPAVTIARALTDSFAGIAPVAVVPFIIAQSIGGVVGVVLCRWLFTDEKQ
jgi:glycerol uptake facilitator-like aquaporin